MTKIIEGNWYSFAEYYDIAFQGETLQEAQFIEAAAKRFCPFPLRRVLEPGCGTGRLVRELASRGYELTAFDLCPEVIDFLRKKLKRRKLNADAFVGDMSDFSLPETFDLAYCFCNTFRHLLTEQSAKNHLQCVSRSLRPGGIYLLGLHVFPPDADLEDCERWTETCRGTRVTTTFRVLSTDLPGRQEILRTNLCAKSADKTVRVRSDYPMRIYSATQLRTLVESVQSLELCEVFDFWYDLEHPVPLDDHISDTVLVLRRRP